MAEGETGSLATSCAHEMNQQLKVFQGRVHTAEKNISAAMDTLKQSMLSTWIAFTSEGLEGAAMVLLANPYVVQLILSQLGPCWEQIMKLVPMMNFKQMMMDMLLKILDEIPYDGASISAIEGTLLAEIAYWQGMYNYYIGIGNQDLADAAQQMWDAAQAAYDNSTDAFTSQNMLTLCKTASVILRNSVE